MRVEAYSEVMKLLWSLLADELISEKTINIGEHISEQTLNPKPSTEGIS